MEAVRVWLRDTAFDFFLPGWWFIQLAALGLTFYLGHRWWPIRRYGRRGHLRRVK